MANDLSLVELSAWRARLCAGFLSGLFFTGGNCVSKERALKEAAVATFTLGLLLTVWRCIRKDNFLRKGAGGKRGGVGGGWGVCKVSTRTSGHCIRKENFLGREGRRVWGVYLQCFLLNCSSHTDVVSSQDFLNFGDLCDTLVSSVPQQVKPKFSKRTSDALTLTGSR